MAATVHIADPHRSLFALHQRFFSRYAWQVYGTYVPPENSIVPRAPSCALMERLHRNGHALPLRHAEPDPGEACGA
jgi:hypothetical protein